MAPLKFPVISTMAVLLLCLFLYKLFTKDMFEDEGIRSEFEFKVPGKSYNVLLYFIPQKEEEPDNIQVRILNAEGEQLLHSYERYNFISTYELLDDSALRLVLSDTSVTDLNADTFLLDLP